MAVGVYMIKNRLSHKRYIGESVDINKRWHEHKRDLRKGNHHCKRLQADWKRYPEITFKFRKIERFWFTKHFVNRDKLILTLLLREGFWMDFFNSMLDYNTEDSLSELKKFCDTGNGNPKFKRYKKYKYWLRKHIKYGKRWMPHIFVASLYNYAVRIFLYVLMGVAIWLICSCFLPTSLSEWVATNLTNILSIVKRE